MNYQTLKQKIIMINIVDITVFPKKLFYLYMHNYEHNKP